MQNRDASTPQGLEVSSLEELIKLLHSLGMERATEIAFIKRANETQMILLTTENGVQHEISADAIDLEEAQEVILSIAKQLECAGVGMVRGVYVSLLSVKK